MSTGISLCVVTDEMPEEKLIIAKGSSELPNKFFVDYASEIKKTKPNYNIVRDPYGAVLYESYEDFLAKKAGRSVDTTLSVQQSGMINTTPKMCLCFIMNNQAG